MIYETPQLETERLILKRGTNEDFVKVYLKIKRDEWRDFIANVSQWEIDNYLTRL